MTATLSNVIIRDGNNVQIPGNVLALDTSGTGAGPWIPAHVLVDGVAGVNRAAVNNSNQLATKGPTAATGTQSSVAGSASDVTILASNGNRLGGSVANDSTAVLCLLLANATSSPTVFSAKLQPSDYYEIPFGYTGVIKGFWASAVGAARVTEFT